VRDKTDTVASLLDDATTRIAHTLGLERREARLEARVLAAFAWDVDPAWLIAHDTDALTHARTAHFESLIQRRLGGEPIAYITGQREFYGRMFQVNPDVLIPRPETELLVETALQHLPERAPCRILDLGAGSGAVAITLALQRPMAEIVAVEASGKALLTAQKNARRLGADNVQCVGGNWYAELGVRRFDMIVSNPPYVPERDRAGLEPEVGGWEPPGALFAGPEGLDVLSPLLRQAPGFLASGGLLALEGGDGQASGVARLMEEAGAYAEIHLRPDLAGRSRVVLGVASGTENVDL